MAILSVDLTYRGKTYRIAEPMREQGGKVTYVSPTSMPVECSRCAREIKRGTRIVLAGIFGMHPLCAVQSGLMNELPDRTVAAEREPIG